MGAGPSGKTNHVIRRWGFELDPSTSGKAKRGVVLRWSSNMCPMIQSIIPMQQIPNKISGLWSLVECSGWWEHPCTWAVTYPGSSETKQGRCALKTLPDFSLCLLICLVLTGIFYNETVIIRIAHSQVLWVLANYQTWEVLWEPLEL